jgi:hypothetical protein
VLPGFPLPWPALGLWVAASAVYLTLGGGRMLVNHRTPPDLTAATRRLASAGLKLPLRAPRVRIRKAIRQLEVSDGDRVVWRRPVALGRSPEGHKQREGDGRTPEGRYRICWRNTRSRFHFFLGLSYPGPEDARAAVERGELDGAVAREVLGGRGGPGECPPQRTALGGFVGIHGHGSALDWTLGCIALANHDIEELWLALPVGTPVDIVP